MKQLDPLNRIQRSESGNVAMTFGLAFLALILVAGVAVDSRRIDTTNNALQASVDSAIIAGAREYLVQSALPDAAREAAATTAAVTAYQTNLAGVGTNVTITTPVVSFPGDGEVKVVATETLPLAFGGLFNKPSVELVVDGTAVAGDSRRVEIVLALDNTSSMFDSGRFTLMRGAAKNFVNIMFDETPAAGLTAISVVPWASTVNINSERPAGWNPASVINTTPPISGSRTIPNAPFANRIGYLYEPDAATPFASQAALDAEFAPVSWRGCIRAAPGERVVNGLGVVSTSLSDAPPSPMRWHAARLHYELDTDPTTPAVPPPPPTPRVGPPSPRPPSPPSPPRPPRPGPQGGLDLFNLDLRLDGLLSRAALVPLPDPAVRAIDCSQSSRDGGFEGLRNIYLPFDTRCTAASNTPATTLVSACVSDPNEFEYFADGGRACTWQTAITPWDQTRPISGPNMNCPTAMLGLSSDRGQILQKLDHMYPVPHGTHADIGLMWGLRSLSPRNEWVNFFGHTGAQAPKAYGDAGVRKVMILLTDGANEEPYDYEGYYGCTQPDVRRQAGRCSAYGGVAKPDRAALDALTQDACDAIRSTFEVELYTIAVNVTDTDAVNLLSDCAGDPTRAFNITAAELDATFEAIAARELRIKQ